MDENGSLYVTDNQKPEVRRYRRGESQETVVAGGNGSGNRLDQFLYPPYVFVDQNHSVYVSDCGNHRVMKWVEGAKQGIVVAGGQGQGNGLTQLACPEGVVVDQLGTVYVADEANDRIMRWPKGATEGSVIVGGHATTINNKEKLSSLKCFSLHCDSTTDSYERSILPLLYRMINLEKLDLHLMILCNEEFVDSNDLKKNIINRIPGLKNFVFNIRSMRYFCNEIRLPLNEDIQHTFNSLQNNQIISYVNYFPEAGHSEYHIYSYPYKLKFYRNITNNFPGGLFKYVTEVSLFDEQPFEHEFFLQIQKSFPFMKELTVINQKPQNKKQCQNFKNYDQILSIIKYPHLTLLNLDCVHDDYIEQFLFDTKMCLSNNLYLIIDYQSLARVTHNFQRNITRINCAKLRYLRLHGECTILKHIDS
ncbi:unnamed protein product [Rotaria sordida]|uniref:NHL repeat containing protein n=1 Tax=Rotaria sordida TaxID=392033 RepID=A0A815XXJ0_9BILA|nr:unnamed protein product [Rotaria sordida]CAF1563189.1 unnamed protein product [Rotaria sordida]